MPTCIHCLRTQEQHLTMSLCPDESGHRFEGNAGYQFRRLQCVGYADCTAEQRQNGCAECVIVRR